MICLNEDANHIPWLAKMDCMVNEDHITYLVDMATSALHLNDSNLGSRGLLSKA
jgi:hypothetical protein